MKKQFMLICIVSIAPNACAMLNNMARSTRQMLPVLLQASRSTTRVPRFYTTSTSNPKNELHELLKEFQSKKEKLQIEKIGLQKCKEMIDFYTNIIALPVIGWASGIFFYP